MTGLKFAFRQLLKNLDFTAVAVLTLALGIEASMNRGASKKTTPISSPKEIIE